MTMTRDAAATDGGPMRIVRRRVITLTILAGVLIAACADDEQQTDTSTTVTTAAATSAVDRWNDRRAAQGFDDSANQRALGVLRRIGQGGVTCTDPRIESFDALVSSYREVALPLPLGSASCTGPAGENLLVEVFPTQRPPSTADFIARKRELVCAKGRELGERPDGTNDFEGLPYVEDRESGWIVEPDSFAVSRQIADVLGADSSNVCPEGSAQR
jgi:hypothetical protein